MIRFLDNWGCEEDAVDLLREPGNIWVCARARRKLTCGCRSFKCGAGRDALGVDGPRSSMFYQRFRNWDEVCGKDFWTFRRRGETWLQVVVKGSIYNNM
jgi:hypothetical protein